MLNNFVYTYTNKCALRQHLRVVVATRRHNMAKRKTTWHL